LPYTALAKYRTVKMDTFALRAFILAGFAPDPLTRDSALDPAGSYTPGLHYRLVLSSPWAPYFYEEIYACERKCKKMYKRRRKGGKQAVEEGKGMENNLDKWA